MCSLKFTAEAIFIVIQASEFLKTTFYQATQVSSLRFSAGGATPINRGKKTRPPFSAHMDQTARIYSENLSRTMIALNVGSGAHGSNSSSSVAGLSNKSQHSNHHQPITMTTSAGRFERSNLVLNCFAGIEIE